jgi:hypothetical protein
VWLGEEVQELLRSEHLRNLLQTGIDCSGKNRRKGHHARVASDVLLFSFRWSWSVLTERLCLPEASCIDKEAFPGYYLANNTSEC